MKSLRRKNGQDEPPSGSGRNAERDFCGDKRIEEPFGWIKTTAGLHKPRLSRLGPGRLGSHADNSGPQFDTPAQDLGERAMTAPNQSEALGQWRMVEIISWTADYVDMLGPVHLTRPGRRLDGVWRRSDRPGLLV